MVVASKLWDQTARGERLSEEEQRIFSGEFSHADERFKTLKGARRWKAILRVYVKNPSATVNVLRFDPESGKSKRLLVCSKFNNRRQDTVVKTYAKGVLDGGAVEHWAALFFAPLKNF